MFCLHNFYVVFRGLAFQFSTVSVIPPMFHTRLCLRITLARRTNARSLETFQKAMQFRKAGSTGNKSITFTFFFRAPKVNILRPDFTNATVTEFVQEAHNNF